MAVSSRLAEYRVTHLSHLLVELVNSLVRVLLSIGSGRVQSTLRILAVFCQFRIDLVCLFFAVSDELVELALRFLAIELCVLFRFLAGTWQL